MTRQVARHGIPPSSGFAVVRSGVIGLARALSLGISSSFYSSVAAAPLAVIDQHGEVPEEPDAARWVLFVISLALVLLGGAFAGLTIALMGQDSIYLQVLAGDPYEPQAKNARRVYDLLQKGKHWVLVTLLLSNVIVNETLPVVLDRCLGGGVAAVVGSTVLIVIFGEVVPQSVCVRYGLQIGGVMAKPVLLMMWLMAPIAWPTAKLLDWALGEDHGTVYKKSGLKTLVTLHKSLGEVGERLNQDEVTIISAVLDLKDKPVANVMTPMDDVFVMAEDTVLDEKTMDRILSEGYSRIPIHAPGRPRDFVGMLLVKILITYDPEDCSQVKDFPLATLPETRPETSCLDIVNFFQEGKSHMVLVSDSPGEDHGALGVVTLEDVIEELIGEEIIDESDVYIDVHKAIRRLTPAPKARPLRREFGEAARRASASMKLVDVDDPEDQQPRDKRISSVNAHQDSSSLSTSPGKMATFLMRRSSAGPDGRMQDSAVPVKANLEEFKRQLRHLGPSNRNTNPRDTKSTTVKIKPVLSAASATPSSNQTGYRSSVSRERHESALDSTIDHEEVGEEQQDNENTPLLRPMVSGKDGVEAIRQSYNVGVGFPSDAQTRLADAPQQGQQQGDSTAESQYAAGTGAVAGAGQDGPRLQMPMPTVDTQQSATQSNDGPPKNPDSDHVVGNSGNGNGNGRSDRGVIPGSSKDNSQTASVVSITDDGMTTPVRHQTVRSGSISENVVETRGGVRKIIIQATSSDSENESKGSGSGSGTGSIKAKTPLLQDVSRESLEEVEDDDETADQIAQRSGAGAAPDTGASNVSQPGGGAHEGTDEGAPEPEASGAGPSGGKKKNKKKKKKGKS